MYTSSNMVAALLGGLSKKPVKRDRVKHIPALLHKKKLDPTVVVETVSKDDVRFRNNSN